KEVLLETMIKQMGYNDAFVRASTDNVHVSVAVNKLSPKEANKIIHMVKTEMGNRVVSVEFKPEKK
ncbi:MAG: SpoIIIAH-like family protein, partial [Bacilli bacterium]